MAHPPVLIVAVPASSSMGAHLLHLLLKPELGIPLISLFISFEHKEAIKSVVGIIASLMQGQRFFGSCQLDLFLLEDEV